MSEPSLTTPTDSGSDELRLIESYKEQTASWRHLDNLLYRFTTIILPVSIAALGLRYLNMGNTGTGNMATEIPKWMPIAGGLALMTFWFFSCLIIEIKTQIRFGIIHDMEDTLRIVGHKEFAERRKKGWRKYFRSHYLRILMFIAYVFAAGVLLKYF